MSSKRKLTLVFESAAESRIKTSIPSIILLTLGILILVLTVIQSYPIVPQYTTESAAQAWKTLCNNYLYEFLSPFHFDIQDAGQYNGGQYGCQWRSRNTTFRVLIVSVATLAAFFELIILYSGRYAESWVAVYWTHLISFVMLFVVFVLDCDSINTGLSSCLKGFEFEGSSIMPSAIVIEKCLITPFIWTALADVAASVTAFCAYSISKYHSPFDVDHVDESDDTLNATAHPAPKVVFVPQVPSPASEPAIVEVGIEVESKEEPPPELKTTGYTGRQSAYDDDRE